MIAQAAPLLINQLAPSQAPELIGGLRGLYARHFAPDRCRPMSAAWGGNSSDVQRMLDSVNSRILPLAPEAHLALLTTADVKGQELPAKVNDHFWADTESERLKERTLDRYNDN